MEIDSNRSFDRGKIARRIISTTIPSMVVRSYGIICFDSERKLTLVVRRRVSAEFLHFIRGFFNTYDIPSIFEKITINEHEIIRNLVNLDPIHFRLTLIDLLRNNFNTEKSRYYYPIASSLIEMNRDAIIEGLNTVTPRLDHEWTWPKGRKNSSYESNLECALRETFEETGLKIDSHLIESSRPIRVETNTFFGMRLEAYYYIVKVDSSNLTVDKAIDSNEIGDVGWKNSDFLRERLPSSKHLEVLNNLI